MASTKNIITILALCAILALTYGVPHSSQGGPHENQNRSRRQAVQDDQQVDLDQEVDQDQQLDQDQEVDQDQQVDQEQQAEQPQDVDTDQDDERLISLPPVWTTCDFTVTPKISCEDCNTRKICKPVGGLLLQCKSPYKPYCNRGICSPVPSAECAAV